MSHRLLQINDNVQRELSSILTEDEDWAASLATITRVMVTPDLRQATVWITTIDQQKAPKLVKLLNLRSSDYYPRLADRLKMKYVPRLDFQADEYREEFDRIESLIDEVSGGHEAT